MNYPILGDPDRKVVLREHVMRGAHGHFSLDLRAGLYTVIATNGGQAVGRTKAHASAGRTVHANITDGDVM